MAVLLGCCLLLWAGPASAVELRLPVRATPGLEIPALADPLGLRVPSEEVGLEPGGGSGRILAEADGPEPTVTSQSALVEPAPRREGPEPVAAAESEVHSLLPPPPPRPASADPGEQPAAFGTMRGEAAALEASVSGAAGLDPVSAHSAAAAPFNGRMLAPEDDASFVFDPDPRWDLSFGSLRMRIGDSPGLVLDVRPYRDLDPALRAALRLEPSVGYFIVDPAATAADERFKGLRDGEEVVLGPGSPGRFAWPSGLADTVRITRSGNVLLVEPLEGPAPDMQFAPDGAHAPPARKGRPWLRRVSADGSAASIAIAKPGSDASEDAVAFDADLGVILVADGVGGGPAGRAASAIAKRVILRRLRRTLGLRPTRSEAREALRAALLKANAAILRYGRRHPGAAGLKTTVAVGVLVEGGMVTANVGDSEIDVRRANGRLQRVTWVESLAEIFRTKVFEALAESGVDTARVRRSGWIRPGDIARAVRRLRALRREYDVFDSDPVVAQAVRRSGRRRAVPLTAYETLPERNVVAHTLGEEDLELYDITFRFTRMGAGDIALAATDGLDNVSIGRRKELARDANAPEGLVDAMAGEALRVATDPRGGLEAALSKPDDISLAAMRARARRAASGRPRRALRQRAPRR